MKITKNTLVYIDYTLHDSEGVHLNPNEAELIYLHGGYGHIFDKFESILDSKVVDDTFDITLPPEDCFGEYDDEMLIKEKLSNLPKDIYVGMELDGDSDGSEEVVIFTVMDIKDGYASLDGNHPLAGKILTFEGVVTKVQELSKEAVKTILKHGIKHQE